MDGLFALGSNGSGQLGLGHKEDVSVPKQVVGVDQPSHDDPVTQVAAGGNHTVLVTASGKAYWTGDYTSGCCGIIEDEDKGDARPIFRRFCLSSPVSTELITYAACAWDTTILVAGDEDGQATRIYSCGTSEGTGGSPVLIVNFPPVGTEVVSIAAGFRHIVVVLNNGDAYGWGNGKKGQLGPLDDGADARGVISKPRKIDGVPFKVARAVCCQFTTCLVAEPGDGRIFVLGADKWALKSQAPAEVPSWKSIVAGWGAIYILKRDGMLAAWGRDDHGPVAAPLVSQKSHISPLEASTS
ncbi:hypothetical protein NUW58_g6809 [Xylaria curta]|uniref:Uncharacterized protein n=1 Tax=Xylaria curta TaxID=42375 RepID=A0ACC1NPV0_9PEZI|nr:hypothetical protein NUW58_g6809 [Xylaria curta]